MDDSDNSNIGIPMDTTTFRSLVSQYLDRIRANSEFNTDDFVTMTRVWNTISANYLEETDPLYGDFAAVFFPSYVRQASQTLGALPSKGMALYAKEYDLFIGGPPHENSQYQLS